MHAPTDTRETCHNDHLVSWADQLVQGSAEQHFCIASKTLPPESPNIVLGNLELNTTLRNPASIYLFEKYDM